MDTKTAAPEISRLMVHPALGGLEMLAARYRDHSYALHTHPTYVFGVVTAGVERFRVGRTDNLAVPGSILVVNPEEPHDGEKGCDAGWSYRTCYPSTKLMREIADDLELADPPMFPSAVLPAPDLARAFVAAHEAAGRGESLESEAAMLSVLRAIVGRFGHRGGRDRDERSSGSTSRFGLYGEIVEADPAAPFALTLFAEAAGVTRFQVVRDFKRAAAMTPGQYVRDRRVRHACTMIGAGTSLAEVAAAAGFADQSHLTRAFKAVKGVTPAAYRRAISG